MRLPQPPAAPTTGGAGVSAGRPTVASVMSRGTGRVVTVRLPAPEAATAIRSAWDAGDAVLVLDPRAPAPEIEGILDRMRPELGVEADVAALVVTSGTAGAAKG